MKAMDPIDDEDSAMDCVSHLMCENRCQIPFEAESLSSLVLNCTHSVDVFDSSDLHSLPFVLCSLDDASFDDDHCATCDHIALEADVALASIAVDESDDEYQKKFRPDDSSHLSADQD